jgi:hypothetical protein
MHQSQFCNYYIALGDAILRSSALHSSGKCIAHSHPLREIRVGNLQHSLRSLVLVRVFAVWTFVFRTSRVVGGKEKDRLPGINIGTQSNLTGLAGISLLPFLASFFLVFGHK